MKKPLVGETDELAFADWFRLNADIDVVLAHFGVTLLRAWCELPRSPRPLDDLPKLHRRIERALEQVSMSNETARREFLIAPVLDEVLQLAGTDGRLRVEFPLDAGPQLHGTLDYLFQTAAQVLIVEAKNADLTRGMTQLAVELVALDQTLEDNEAGPWLCGAVTTGTSWQFGFLERPSRRFAQDLTMYSVPADLATLLQTLVALATDPRAAPGFRPTPGKSSVPLTP